MIFIRIWLENKIIITFRSTEFRRSISYNKIFSFYFCIILTTSNTDNIIKSLIGDYLSLLSSSINYEISPEGILVSRINQKLTFRYRILVASFIFSFPPCLPLSFFLFLFLFPYFTFTGSPLRTLRSSCFRRRGRLFLDGESKRSVYTHRCLPFITLIVFVVFESALVHTYIRMYVPWNYRNSPTCSFSEKVEKAFFPFW